MENLAGWLPHCNALLNVTITFLLIWGLAAIRAGKRDLHPRLMKTAVVVGVLFLIGYVIQTVLVGHQRFPGDDWVRVAFLWILGTHTTLAVCVVPMILRTLFLAFRERFAEN